MWQARTETDDASGRTLKLVPEGPGGPLTYADVIRLWSDSPEFRAYFNSLLAAAPFAAFRWETPPVTVASRNLPFECVLLDSPGLAGTPDPAAFAEHFRSPDEDGVATFPSLGRDALLIVPRPAAADPSAYGHLAAFVRSPLAGQQQALWREVGRSVADRLSESPLWLSTAGAGVPWLHVRLDSRPKYYGYAAYRAPRP